MPKMKCIIYPSNIGTRFLMSLRSKIIVIPGSWMSNSFVSTVCTRARSILHIK